MKNMQDMIVELINKLQEDLEIAYREFLDNKISMNEYIQVSTKINTSVADAIDMLPNAKEIRNSCNSDIESIIAKTMHESSMEIFDVYIDAVSKTEK
jgi:predicted nucleic acid-binding protein